MRQSTLLQAGTILALLTSQVAWARGDDGAASSSAGVMQRQLQLEYNLKDLSPTKAIPILEIDIPQEVLDLPEGVSVYIERINIEQNFPIFQKEIQEALAPYLHRTLTGQDVIDLCQDIEAIYASSGYILAWVYPPAQKVVNNTLTIEIVEGTLGKIEVSGNTSYSTAYIQRYFADLQGKPINYNELMKALLLVNENTDLSIEGILKKGTDFGDVDLLLNVQDQRPVHLNVGYNNWGQTSVTYNQMTSTFTFGNLATSGDKLTLMTTVGVPAVLYYINPVYSIPLTGSGARLDLSFVYTYSNTQEFPELDLAGWSEIGTITYSQPISRTRQFDADIYASFEINQSKNLEQGFTTSFDKLRILSFGGKINYTDSASGRNMFDAYIHAGIPNFLGGSPAVNDIASTPGSGGRFFILNIDYQRIQPLLTDCMFVFTGNAQGTFNTLAEPEQFILGGEGTVRGYESAIALGDMGYCTNFEFYIPPPFFKNKMFKPMKKKWGDILQLLAFIDHGAIYTAEPINFEPAPAYLTSVGAGFRFYGPKNLNISFDAAFPVMNQYKNFNSVFYIMVNMDFF